MISASRSTICRHCSIPTNDGDELQARLGERRTGHYYCSKCGADVGSAWDC